MWKTRKTRKTKKATPSVPPPAAPRPRPGAILPLLAFGLVSLLLYGNSLDNAFVHDDKPLVAENSLIRDPRNLGRIFSSGYWTTGDLAVPSLYRPLAIASLAVNHLLGGVHPLGYHLANLLLHAGVCWLIYRMALLLSGGPAVAWVSGLLFAAHPVHTEAVTPVVGRSELMAAGFFLAAFLLDRRARRGDAGHLPRAAAANACYLAALLSKENTAVLPLLLIATDLVLDGNRRPRIPRRRLLDYALYGVTALAYLALRMSVLGHLGAGSTRPLDNPLVTAGGGTAFRTALVTAGRYVGLLVWPAHLSADYSLRQIPLATGWGDPRLAGALLALTAAAGIAVWGWRQCRLATWSVVFYALAMLPVSNLLFPIGTIFGERLVYLPSVGFCLLGGLAFSAFHRRRPPLALSLLALTLLAGGLRTVARNRIWQDDGTFARATAADSPRSAKAQHNLGAYLEDHGDIPGAEAAYRKASQLDPSWADTHSNLAGILAKLGRVEEAIAEYQRAIALRGDVLRYSLNLGYVLYQAGRHDEAIALYRQIRRTTPASAPIHTNLGANLLALGRTEEAVAAYQEAVTLDPSNPDYFRNLGQALAAGGEMDRAVAALRTAVHLRPRADLRAVLGLALLDAGRPGEAVSQLSLASAAEPANSLYHFNLARALEGVGREEQAEREYRATLNRDPRVAPALRNLGLLLARRGNAAEAASLLRQAAALTPGGLDPEARSVLQKLP